MTARGKKIIPLGRPDQGCRIVVLALRPGRTSLRTVTPLVDPNLEVRIGVSVWAVAIEWPEPLPTDRAIDLEIEFEGEPVDAIEIRWLVQYPEGEASGESLADDGASSPASLASAFRFDVLRRAFARPMPGNPELPDVAQSAAYQEFFRDFDYSTNVKLFKDTPVRNEGSAADVAERERIVTAVDRLLETRTDYRDAAGELQPNVNVRQVEERVTTCDVRQLSSLMLGIMRRHAVLTRYGRLDFDRIAEAFNYFASGHLQYYPGLLERKCSVFNARPDGPKLFLFAEFALLALDRAVDVGEWSRLIVPFVRIQKLFIETVADLTPPDCGRIDPLPLDKLERELVAFEIRAVRIGARSLYGEYLKHRREVAARRS